jgi:membrane glycosyltransferase
VAKLLEKRFVQALKPHLKNQAEAHSSGDPLPATHTTAWLMPLRQELHAALLAELDTRLQPTLGLLEAYNPENPS